MENSTNSSAEKYPILRAYVGFYKIVAVIVGVTSLGFYFYFCSSSHFQILGWVAIVLGGVISLLFIALSEIIRVFLDIELNTRKEPGKQ